MVTHKWLAIRLSDGAPTVCSMIQSATRSVIKAMNSSALMLRCAICGRELAEEMARFLQFNRDAYDAGFRLPDPDSNDGGPSF